jgi:formylglycine-generating enzyme required for sulfatase activity
MASRGAGERGELTPRDLLRALGGAVGEEAADGTDERRRLRGGPLHMLGPRWGAVMARVAAGGVGVGVLAAAWNIGNSAGSERFRETHGNPAAARAMSGLVGLQGDSVVKTKMFGSDVMLGAAVAASMTVGALAGDAVQWRVEDGGNGHWYQSVASSGSWTASESSAENKGGHLVTINSSAESSWIKYKRQYTWSTWGNWCWYGGKLNCGTVTSPNCVDCHWEWTNGEAFDFTNWAPGEPNCGYSTERVGSLGTDWADLFDSYPVPSAIIEWSADCNSDGIVDYGQILAGQLADANSNGIPDICECATHPELGACRCAGDIVADGTVNGADLGTLLAYWGPRTSGSFSIASDINGDARIDGSDLGVLLANWGTCTPAGPTVPGWATLIEAFPDPAVVTDPTLRMAIAATGLAWRVRDTGTGIEMLLVPPGTFQMGCTASNLSACNDDESPSHPVTLTQAFYLGRYEVTQGQWVATMGSNPSYFQGSPYPDSANRPVEQVTWSAAQDYVRRTGMRLPSEAEWEFACRANTTTAFYNGSSYDSTATSIAWYVENSGSQTHAVGGKAANALGFFDMAGNVWEWVNDWYGSSYYSVSPSTNPEGPLTGTSHVQRGGSWYYDSGKVRSSYRITYGGTGVDFGFRVARNP